VKSTLTPVEGEDEDTEERPARKLVKLSVEVDEAEFDKDIDAAFRKIAREVRIPGFRPGKAPRRVLEARIGVAPAREQALRDAIPSYLAKAVREHDVDIIATPEVDITGGEEDGPVQFDATIEIRPQISVPGYGGLRVELPDPAVSDEELDARIDALRRPFGELNDVDRAAAEGDFVTIDLSAARDGEPVPGLDVEDWQYQVGQAWITDDFDDYLVGALADDRREFTSTPRGTEEPADFSLTVKKVQELVLPELDDAWVEENSDHATVEELRAHQREQLEAVRTAQARLLLVERATDALAELVDDEAPAVLVDNELRGRVQDMLMRLQAQGLTLEQYLEATGTDQAVFVESLREAATKAVKVDLALRAVADAEQLQVDDDDLDAEYARIAVRVNQKPNQVRKAYERNDAIPELRWELRKRKALDWLLEHVEIVDTEGKPIDRATILPTDDEVAEAVGSERAPDHDHEGHDHDGHDHADHDHAHDEEHS
jgi:trigger factor